MPETLTPQTGLFIYAKSRKEAMDIGGNITKPKDWHENKLLEMSKIVRKKAEVCEPFINALQKAADKYILGDASYPYWG